MAIDEAWALLESAPAPLPEDNRDEIVASFAAEVSATGLDAF